MPAPTSSRRSPTTRIARSCASSAASRTSSRSTGARSTSPRPWRRKAARLFAGDICNTNVYDPADAASHKAVRAMFEEQVGWAVDAGVDFIIGETFSYAQEALIALDVIKRAGQTAVITLAMHQADVTRENWARRRRVQAAGRRRRRRRRPELHPRPGDDDAAAARDPRRGQDAHRGAAGSLPHQRARAVVPVAARCALALRRGHPAVSGRARSVHLQSLRDRRIRPRGARRWASATSACAAAPGRITSARWPRRSASIRRRSKYSADMSKHAFLGSHERIKKVQKDYASKL